jgi:capsular polysaccharide biosynthesis protein
MADTQPVRIDVSARTPQAADDVANAGEDAVSLLSIAQLISNDRGGNARQF